MVYRVSNLGLKLSIHRLVLMCVFLWAVVYLISEAVIAWLLSEFTSPGALVWLSEIMFAHGVWLLLAQPLYKKCLNKKSILISQVIIQ